MPEEQLPNIGGEQQDVKGRIDFHPSSNKKAPKAYVSPLFVFGIQQTGYQKTTEHKKKIHPHPAHLCGQGENSRVTSDYQQDSGTAQDV
jgi:hypothetical protein